MRKLILRWLFGTNNIKSYMDVLTGSVKEMKEHTKSIKKTSRNIR